jgi:hypothetical protein
VTNDFDINSPSLFKISNCDMVNFVSQTADLINGTDIEFEISDGENQRTFVDNFKLDSHLSDDQIDQLKHLLYNNYWLKLASLLSS